MGIPRAASASTSKAFKAPFRASALAAIAMALLVLAHESRLTLSVPMERKAAQPQVDDVEALGFGDWLEKIKSQIGDALEKAKDNAKKILDDIKEVSGDAWEKIKQAVGEIEVAKDKFVEKVLPKILEALKEASKKGAEKMEPIIKGVVSLLKDLGQKALKEALAYLSKHKDEIDHKIFDIIMGHLNNAIDKVTGSYSFAHDVVDDDQLKLILVKMLDRCAAMDSSAEISAILTLAPFGFQRAVSILRDMKIENPYETDSIDGLLVRVEAVAGIADQSAELVGGKNIFEDILNKIIARVDENPEKVATILIGIFGPLGKDVMQHLIDNLREMLAAIPDSESLNQSIKTIIKKLEESLNESKVATKIDWTVKLTSGREGEDILDALKGIAEEAMTQLVDGASSLKEVEEQVVKRLLPALIEIVKKMANKTSEAAKKVAEVVVSLLRRLGSRAIQLAIEFLDDHAEAIGDRLHDFLLSLLQDALAEISYVREVGFAHLAAALNRGRA